MMKRTLVNKTLTPLVLVGSLIGVGGLTSGCADIGRGIIKDSPIGWYHQAKEEIKVDVRNENQIEGEHRYDPWKGTAVVNRIVNPDGSIIFMLDARKIGKKINTNYADKFLDATKYEKTWEWYQGKMGFIITYIPKQ